MNRFLYLSILILALGLSCCSNNDPIYELTPTIEFISISPEEVEEFGPFVLELSFQDGDGDLGGTSEGQSTPFNLFLQDLRAGYPLPDGGFDGLFKYSLPDLTPDSRNPSIQGEIKIDLGDIGIIHPDSLKESARFEIWILDRAGNKSNVVVSEPLVINRPQ